MAEYRKIPRHPDYRVGDDGSVIGKSGRPMRLQMVNGYPRFAAQLPNGKGAQVFVHVAVCEAWHGLRPAGKEVAHANGRRDDNRPDNLSWKTRTENHADKRDHGTHVQGEAISWSKLTEDDVREIKRCSHESTPVLGKRFGVSPAAIWFIRVGRNWKHVQ